MAVLHGSWLGQNRGGYLFIWGEMWRSVNYTQERSPSDIFPIHPLAMSRKELADFLAARGLDLSKSWQTVTVALPTAGEQPILSFNAETDSASLELQPWQVAGITLSPLAATKFLQALPLSTLAGNYLGGDLRFWSQVYRWSLDLIARCKFLPTLQTEGDEAIAQWLPLLDGGSDRDRLKYFTKQMPAICRAYLLTISNQPLAEIIANNSPQTLLLEFLCQILDSQVRQQANNIPLPTTTDKSVQEWLQALATGLNLQIKTEVKRLESALQVWAAPVKEHLVTSPSEFGQKLFRTCFRLEPPTKKESNWTLQYCLQSVADAEFWVDAVTIWNHPVERLVYQGRIIEFPQETFLKGLGLAARIYPFIEPSLHVARPQFCLLTATQAYEFIKAAVWRLQDSGFGTILPPSLRPENAGNHRLGLKVRADVDEKKSRLGLQSLLKFKFELAIGEQSLSVAEFKRLVALQTPLVEINGEWMALQPQDIRAAEAVLATPKEQLTLSIEDALRLSTGDSKTLEKLPVVSFESSGVLQALVTNLTDSRSIEAIAPPANFRGELRPYQGRGVAWLSFLEHWGLGACLADDMGLGKTIELIAFLLHLQEKEGLTAPTLLVCPTSVLGNWEREVKKFAPTLKVLVFHGNKRLKGKEFTKAVKEQDLIITSYSLVYRDAKAMQGISWQGVVLDEAQNIKNAESKQSQAVRELSAGFRIALTGTPVENRLSELWSILDFLNPGYLGNRQFFQRRFAMPIERYGDMDSLKTLRSLVQPFILRRLKTDREIIQDLPEKQEMSVFCGLSAEQASLYEKVVEASLVEIEGAEGIQRRGLVLSLLVKLKQICNHPAHFLKENDLGNLHRSGKLRRLEEMLEEVILAGDRALVFTQFAEWGKLLQFHLQQQLGWETLLLHGGIRQPQREVLIDRFQNDPEAPRIFILSLKAGGTGLNLTRANHVFHFDRWWNPAVENQATDRVFRIGQTRNVQVHKFICNGTLEERINDIIEGKKYLAEQTVGAGEQWLTEMNSAQLRSLLLLDRTAVIDDE